MSEKLYAWLLRLYPSRFREDYGEEALRLFRDRARDERGFLPRVRLWLDLVFDFTISLPSEYFHVPAPRVAPLVPRRLHGFPALFVLENASPRPGALAIGGLLSLAALVTQQMREVTPDRHLTFDYFQEPLPPQPSAQTTAVSPQYREAMKQQNCTFEKVELLPRNIGYFKLNSFPDPEVCRVAAMAA